MLKSLRNYLSPILMVAAAVLLIAGLVALLWQSTKEDSEKKAWFLAHYCRPEGYANFNYRTYRCDDGVLYTWRDIPRLIEGRTYQ